MTIKLKGLIYEMVDQEIHRIGEDPSESHSDTPINWNKSDCQMNAVWSVPTIQNFLGLSNKFTAIYRSILEVAELDYTLAEEDPEDPENEGGGGYDWDEFRCFGRRGIPPIVVVREENGAVKLADGNHRLKWATDVGYRTIGCWVVDKLVQKELDRRNIRKKK